MVIWIKQLLTAPVFEDNEDKTRVAGLLNIILPALFVIVSLFTLLTGLHAVESGNIMMGAVTAFLALLLWFIMRRGHVQLAGILFSSLFFICVTFMIYAGGTVRAPITVTYSVCIVSASLLIGARAAIGFNVLVLLALFGLLQAETAGERMHDWLTYAAVFSLTTVLLNLAARSINDALERARSHECVLDERAKEIAIFRALAENATDVILMSTLEGSITYANRAGYEIFGCDHEGLEMIGMRISDLMPKDEAENVNQRTISTTLRKGSWRGEMKHQRKDGSIFDADSTVFVVQGELGEQAALATIIRDITEQKQAEVERERLQQDVIDAQRQALLELSSPVIPVMERIIVMPLVGNIDSARAKDVTRSLLSGIRTHHAEVVILDITGVSVVDSGVAEYLNKTVQAARLKGARTIITGISEDVAETIVTLGIDWGGIETVSDLQTGLVVAFDSLGIRLIK
ncbi:MAG: PAS domain S-box protein [Chloroflexi bacterium]|nr:PAS domain S-box protein [Chloroflexota bacterium]